MGCELLGDPLHFPVFLKPELRTASKSQESFGICAGCRDSVTFLKLCCSLAELIGQLVAVAEREDAIGPQTISLKASVGYLFF